MLLEYFHVLLLHFYLCRRRFRIIINHHAILILQYGEPWHGHPIRPTAAINLHLFPIYHMWALHHFIPRGFFVVMLQIFKNYLVLFFTRLFICHCKLSEIFYWSFIIHYGFQHVLHLNVGLNFDRACSWISNFLNFGFTIGDSNSTFIFVKYVVIRFRECL